LERFPLKQSRIPERRRARRYPVSMRMEIWPEAESRRPDPVFVGTRDISMRGIYYLSEVERAVGEVINFCVILLPELTGKPADLLAGIARVVRCEPQADGVPPYGIAIAIERTTHLHGDPP
jgi:hypothetical protein